MENDDEAASRFLVIFRFMWADMGLSGVTLHVYARIYGFCRGGGLFYESRGATARFLGTTSRTVSRSISELLACGLIHECGDRQGPNGGSTRCYSIASGVAKRFEDAPVGQNAGRIDPVLHLQDEASPPDKTSWGGALNPDGSSGDPVTGCHPKSKDERKGR